MKQVFLLLFLVFSTLTANDEWENGLDWQYEFTEAMQVAKYHKKPIFMFLESRTCFYCPKLKEEIFNQPEFQEKIKKYFIPVLLDNSLDADSDVENTGQCPPRLTVSMTPAIYFLGPNEEKLSRRGKKHMIIYGMWTLPQMLAWMDDAIAKFEKLHGETYDFKK
jgi:thioredoxin-related protein